jgi:hypothetical protein
MEEWMYRHTFSWPRHWLVSGQLHAPVALSPVPIGWEVGWTPEPVWTTWRSEYSWPYLDSVVQPVASRYTDWAIPAHSCLGRGKLFLCSTSSRPVLGPIQPLIRRVAGAISAAVERPWSWSLTSNKCRCQNTWIYISTPPYAFMA